MAVNHVGRSAPNWTDSNIKDYLEMESWEKTKELWFPIVFMSLLMLIGIPGNALVFMAFWKSMEAISVRVFFLSMAVCGFITNISFPLSIVRLRFLYNFPDPGLCQATIVFQRLPVMVSGWLLMAVALDLYLRICHNFQLASCMALILVLVSAILESSATFPFVRLYGDLSVPTDRSDVNGTQCGMTKQETPIYIIMENYTPMLIFLIWAVTMIFCYGCIARRLHVHHKVTAELSAVATKSEESTIWMMLVLTVTAMVCFLPFIVLKGLNYDDDEFAYCKKQTGWRLSACMVGLLFPNINSAANLFIYSLCYPCFRRRFRQILTGRCWG